MRNVWNRTRGLWVGNESIIGCGRKNKGCGSMSSSSSCCCSSSSSDEVRTGRSTTAVNHVNGCQGDERNQKGGDTTTSSHRSHVVCVFDAKDHKINETKRHLQYVVSWRGMFVTLRCQWRLDRLG